MGFVERVNALSWELKTHVFDYLHMWSHEQWLIIDATSQLDIEIRRCLRTTGFDSPFLRHRGRTVPINLYNLLHFSRHIRSIGTKCNRKEHILVIEKMIMLRWERLKGRRLYRLMLELRNAIRGSCKLNRFQEEIKMMGV